VPFDGIDSFLNDLILISVFSHPHIPELDVVAIHFGGKRWSKKNGEINVDAIER
jgi:hypothetical protein